MTLDDPLKSRLPSISAAQRPQIVLFDPTVATPEIRPDTWITAGVEPPAAALNADNEVTVTGLALPPPVVPPL